MTDPGMVTVLLASLDDYTDNGTETVDVDGIVQRPLLVQIALAVSLSVIITVCLLGNVTVLFAFSRCTELREQNSSVFILNLALTDIGCATTVMPFVLVSIWYDRWVFGPLMCGFVCFLNYCFIIVSMATLAMISIDRHLYCIYPFRYRELMTRRRAVVFSAMTWCLGVFFGAAPSVMEVVIYNHAEIICAVDWEADPAKVLTYTVTAFVICFITPMVVMVYCYQGLYRVAHRHARQLQQREVVAPRTDHDQSASDSVGDNNITKDATLCESKGTPVVTRKQDMSRKRTLRAQERRTTRNSKAIRSICIMVAAYFICNTPFSLTKLLKCVYSNNDVVPFYLNAAASWIAFANPCCNPIIYSIYREDFKAAIRRLLPSSLTKVNIQVSPVAAADAQRRGRGRSPQSSDGGVSPTPLSSGQDPVFASIGGERSSNNPAIIISPPEVKCGEIPGHVNAGYSSGGLKKDVDYDEYSLDYQATSTRSNSPTDTPSPSPS